MKHSWMVDVLNDLQDYAQENDLELTAAELSQVSVFAATTINALIEEQEAELPAA